ncbi:MAG: peptidoglycan-binding protein, partial [Paracoccaceae bacterium]|nr:peptidoglycan-binding protein [Paracoccaceae bacterium]
MLRQVFAVVFIVLLLVRGAWAQEEVVWVQIEARPTLAEAQERARSYAARLPDVNGFVLPSGWYALALGPYTRGDADQVLRVYRGEGTIPNDSFIAFTNSFRQQFWPIGANLLSLPQPATPPDASVAPEPEAQPVVTDQAGIPQPPLPDESPNEARASEGQLSR